MQKFYIEAVSQIRSQFPIGDLIIEMLQDLDPGVSRPKFYSLYFLAMAFPNIISESQQQALDDQ